MKELFKKEKVFLSNDRNFGIIFIMKKLDNSTGWIFFTNLIVLIEEYQNVLDLNLIGFPGNLLELLEKQN